MATVIIYSTRHGATKKCAELLKFKLFGSELADLKEALDLQLSGYDTVILGGSIQAGKVKGAFRKYCEKNKEELLKKKLGLYICCMSEDKQAEDQLKNIFPRNFMKKHWQRIISGVYLILQK